MQGANGNPAAAWRAMTEFYGRIWWALLLVMVIQGIGMLGLLALLTDQPPDGGRSARHRGQGVLPLYRRAAPPGTWSCWWWASWPGSAPPADRSGVTVLLVLLGMVAAVYLFAKFSLTSRHRDRAHDEPGGRDRPLMAADQGQQRAAVASSMLLLFVLIVVAMLLSAVFGLIGVVRRGGGQHRQRCRQRADEHGLGDAVPGGARRGARPVRRPFAAEPQRDLRVGSARPLACQPQPAGMAGYSPR